MCKLRAASYSSFPSTSVYSTCFVFSLLLGWGSWIRISLLWFSLTDYAVQSQRRGTRSGPPDFFFSQLGGRQSDRQVDISRSDYCYDKGRTKTSCWCAGRSDVFCLGPHWEQKFLPWWKVLLCAGQCSSLPTTLHTWLWNTWRVASTIRNCIFNLFNCN